MKIDQSYTPNEMIGAIRGYVEHFLGCRDCARNFIRGATQTLDGDSAKAPHYRRDRNGAALWMWYSHNRANYFLADDPTEDPQFPKVQFPLAESCPECHSGGEDAWNETAVFEYLQDYYRASSIVDDDPHDGYDPNSGTMFLKKARGHSRSAADARSCQVPVSARRLTAVCCCLVSLLTIPGIFKPCC